MFTNTKKPTEQTMVIRIYYRKQLTRITLISNPASLYAPTKLRILKGIPKPSAPEHENTEIALLSI